MEGFENVILNENEPLQIGFYIVKSEHTEDQLKFMQENLPSYEEGFIKKAYNFPWLVFDLDLEFVNCIEDCTLAVDKVHFNDLFKEV